MDVSQTNSQKPLRVVLDSKLIFHNHLDIVFTKVRKTIGLLHKLNNILPRAALLTTFKAFVRPQLDYGDVLYHLALNSTFHDKLESIQYNACFTITGAIRCTSRGKLHQELGLESLQLRRWYGTLGLLYNILNIQIPIFVRLSLNTLRNFTNLLFFNSKHRFFESFVFPLTIIEWNKLDINLCNSKYLFIFKKSILQFIQPSSSSLYK